MLSGLLGGVLIGLAATVYLLATGRVAGVSGILAGRCNARGTRRADRVPRRARRPADRGRGRVARRRHAHPTPVLIVAGVLVGFGTRLGGGCTSGHGVCGVSRLSRASLVATATFIATGAATVAIANHLFFAAGTP